MTTASASGTTRVTEIAPQFLVDDLDVSIMHYQERLGFDLDFRYEDFYASVRRDGARIHLKCAPKIAEDRVHREVNDHLDAYIAVAGVGTLFEELTARGATITSPLKERPWLCTEFWVQDADGYILCFSEPTAQR